MVHQHNLLKVIKPVDFHYFGKAHKSHFDHRICIKTFTLQFGSYNFAKLQNSITVRRHYIKHSRETEIASI